MLTVRQIADAVGCSKMTVARVIKSAGIQPEEVRGNTPLYFEGLIDLVRRSMVRRDTANSPEMAPEAPQDTDSAGGMMQDVAPIVARCDALERENAVLKAQNAELLNRIEDLQRNAEAMQSNMEALQRLSDTLTSALASAVTRAIPDQTPEHHEPEAPRHWWQRIRNRNDSI